MRQVWMRLKTKTLFVLSDEPVILLAVCVGETRLRSASLWNQEIVTHAISLHLSSSKFTSSSRYTSNQEKLV